MRTPDPGSSGGAALARRKIGAQASLLTVSRVQAEVGPGKLYSGGGGVPMRDIPGLGGGSIAIIAV